MKPRLLNDPFHNPFYNKFNDPVQRRRDDMQSHEYTVWLRDSSRAMSIMSPAIAKDASNETAQRHHSRLLTGLLVLSVFVAISAAAVVTFGLR